MSGYKQAILNLNPKFFITFDGDAFDVVNRTIVAIPNQLIDESGNGNNAILHFDSSGTQSYKMGTASLIQQEPSSQYSLQIAPVSPSPTGFTYPKAYLEIPNSSSFSFLSNHGSFSVTMTVNKANWDSTWWNTFNTNPKRILMQKGSAFSLYTNIYFSSNEYLFCVLPDGSTLGPALGGGGSLFSAFIGTPRQITFTWNVKVGTTTPWQAIATIYVDDTIWAQKVINYADISLVPNTNNSTSFEILGQAISSPTNMLEDRQTSPITVDQIACFDFALSADQVAFLHKKTMYYDLLVSFDRPAYYANMGEVYSTTGGFISPSVNTHGLTGKYNGISPAQLIDRVPGPTNIPGSVGRGFQSGGSAYINNGSYTSPAIVTSGDITVAFWAQINSSTQCTVFNMTEGTAPYRGFKLQANTKNGGFVGGSMQFSGSEYVNVVSLTGGNWTDGNWHHFAMVNRGGTMELWIDGALQGTNTYPGNGGINPPGQIYLMADTGGNECTGSMYGLEIYEWALNPQTIKGRFSYAVIYKVQGTVTLAGLPYQANIRFYRHANGALLQEILSDPGNGTYLCKLMSGETVDMVALNMQDANVRYRVYGPIVPSQYPDPPS